MVFILDNGLRMIGPWGFGGMRPQVESALSLEEAPTSGRGYSLPRHFR